MDWARDQLGNLVHASQRGLFSYGLSCPTCGEPVRRRAGPQRRPHFAHYSHSAKPECENYYPSWGVAAAPGPRRVSSDEPAASSAPSLQGGLFLERTDQSSYSLYLKLPQLPAGTSGAGEIEIRSGLGIRTYTVSQLYRPRLVPVVPQLPLVEVIAAGNLSAAGAAIKTHVERFRGAGNYFRASDVGGRLLVPNEPLEWGERYLLLTQQAIGPIPEGLGLGVETQKEWRGWYVYEIALPALPQMESELGREELCRYLERTIKTPRPRAYFIDPPPHHIEPDGTYVFPEKTERIFLRRTEHLRIDIEVSPKIITLPNVRYLTGEWVEITDIGVGGFTVILDGREELLGRIEECDLFQPIGVRVAVGDRTWEIFEPGLREAIRLSPHKSVNIECPSLRVADHLALAENVGAQDGPRIIISAVLPGPVNADNFGALAWPAPGEAGIEPTIVDAQTRARRAWLEGLVASCYGPDALMRLREQWGKALCPGYRESDIHDLACLYPHIQFARTG